MTVHRVYIEEALYDRLEHLARKHRRTVPATLALILSAALPKHEDPALHGDRFARLGEQLYDRVPVPKPGGK